MSANIDAMIYVNETPWHNLGIDLSANPPKSAADIIKAGDLGWETKATPATSAFHDRVLNYHVIYREDNGDVLGMVDQKQPRIVQNEDMFNTFDEMLDDTVDFETAASLGIGQQVFGCFKLRKSFKLLDDDVEHYIVVLNEHLKTDGKITILNTPIRVVCQNTLACALDNNLYRFRIPVTSDTSVNATLASKLLKSVDDALERLQKRAEELVNKKIDRNYVEKLLDEMFPYVAIPEDTVSETHIRANEAISMTRETFLTQCMNADNLANYKGTQWQVFNALTDFSGHYFKSLDKAYDLNYRMKLLPGVGTDSPSTMVTKYLKIADKLVA